MIRESHRVQRAVERRGYATSRHSGGAFKIDVPDADGSVRGLDVFGGFFTEGHLALLGEIWAPYEREWVFPLGTVTLDGRELPAPADPERLLAETYGPGWRVPDPAFRYEKDPDVQRRFDEWFRGTRLHRAAWDHRYGLARLLPPYQPPHDVSRHLHEREDPGTWVLDVGCGRGRDVRWLAKQGRPAVGLDYSGVAMQFIADKAAEQGWPAELRTMNLLELRHVLAWGALLSARPGPRTVLARHLIDSTSPYGVDNFWRLVSMVLRPGERVHLEFLTEPDRRPGGPPVPGAPPGRGRRRRRRRAARRGGHRRASRPRRPGDRLRLRRRDVRRQAVAVLPPGGGVAMRLSSGASVKDLEARVQDLEAQVAALTSRVQEGAVLHQRFAELLDVVTELLPGADPAAVQRYVDELGSWTA